MNKDSVFQTIYIDLVLGLLFIYLFLCDAEFHDFIIMNQIVFW